MFVVVVDVSAYEIIKLKGYTSWAIGIMVSTLCSAMLRNMRQLYTLSTNAKACYYNLSVHLSTTGKTLFAYFLHLVFYIYNCQSTALCLRKKHANFETI